jgi:hypothetical protein
MQVDLFTVARSHFQNLAIFSAKGEAMCEGSVELSYCSPWRKTMPQPAYRA